MTSFTFQSPTALLLLILLIPLGWLLHRARAKRRIVTQALGTKYSTHRKLRDILRLTALTLAIAALAKPGHSPQTQSISTTGRDVVFALDVSRSMLAQDVIPSRLEVAKQGIRDALETLDTERVGLVVYAGSASILCPLTYDHDFVAHMLDQAHPRSVDFGGTTMQSAIEKIVDQVFLPNGQRENVQDIIILTDGGDHGSKIPKIAQLLDTHKADTLIIGIGNPNQSSPIPITTPEGNNEDLTIDGKTIFTRLDDATLTNLAHQSSRATYHPVATAPFNLGQLYIDYAKDKTTATSDSENGFTLYQDASIYFLAPAIILLILAECWGLKGLQLGHAAALIFTLYHSPLNAAENQNQNQTNFNTASSLMAEKKYEEANEKLSELYQQLNDQPADSKTLAATTYNQGLCYYQLSQQQADESTTQALTYALKAQQSFLSAKRYDTNYTRAAKRIITTSTWINTLEEIQKKQQQADEALEKEIQALIQELQSILDAQTKLKEDVRISERQHKNHTTPEVITLAKLYNESQQKLTSRSTTSKEVMLKLHQKLMMPSPTPDQAPESIMTKPLTYIDQVITSQQTATNTLADRSEWSASRSPQANAITLLQEIIDLLSSNSDQTSDEDSEEYEDDEGDYEESDEDGESTTTSESMQGDLSSTSQMQALPEPNYSAEDILQEEQSNLQFRQEKRADQNAAKVKKDY
ncbi:MAG: VWA domain-containing protein [Akkermansiaceae bacterium]